MITGNDKKILESVLGRRNSKEVLKILADKGIKSNNDKPFTSSYIRLVLNGSRENSDIELAYWEAYQNEKQKQAAIKKKREAAQQAAE